VELVMPQHAIGRNTIAAVQSGVVSGHTAMIEGMVARVRTELGGARHVVLTGGLSSAIVTGLSVVTEHVPDLTLRGLHMLYRRNCQAQTNSAGQ
jgi:type III pantothenate kinase